MDMGAHARVGGEGGALTSTNSCMTLLEETELGCTVDDLSKRASARPRALGCCKLKLSSATREELHRVYLSRNNSWENRCMHRLLLVLLLPSNYIHTAAADLAQGA